MNNNSTKKLKRSLLISVGLVSLASYLFTWLLDRSREAINPAFILAPAMASVMLGVVVFLIAIRAAKQPVGWIGPVFSVFGLLVFGLLSIVLLRPDLLPHHTVYDFIENRKVTERLVDPDLMNVYNWEIQGQERRVLFAHPSEKGTTALIFPVKIQPGMVFSTYLAMAPEVWTKEGDGVIFAPGRRPGGYSRYLQPLHRSQTPGAGPCLASSGG